MQLETATRKGPVFICLSPANWQKSERITPAPIVQNLALRPAPRSPRRLYRLALEIPLVQIFIALLVLFFRTRNAAQERAGQLAIVRVVMGAALTVIYTDLAYSLVAPVVNVTFQGGIA